MQTIARTGSGVRPIKNGQPVALLMAGGKGRRVSWIERFNTTLVLKFGTLDGLTNDLKTLKVRDPNCADRTVYIPASHIEGGFTITR